MKKIEWLLPCILFVCNAPLAFAGPKGGPKEARSQDSMVCTPNKKNAWRMEKARLKQERKADFVRMKHELKRNRQIGNTDDVDIAYLPLRDTFIYKGRAVGNQGKIRISVQDVNPYLYRIEFSGVQGTYMQQRPQQTNITESSKLSMDLHQMASSIDYRSVARTDRNRMREIAKDRDTLAVWRGRGHELKEEIDSLMAMIEVKDDQERGQDELSGGPVIDMTGVRKQLVVKKDAWEALEMKIEQKNRELQQSLSNEEKIRAYLDEIDLFFKKHKSNLECLVRYQQSLVALLHTPGLGIEEIRAAVKETQKKYYGSAARTSRLQMEQLKAAENDYIDIKQQEYLLSGDTTLTMGQKLDIDMAAYYALLDGIQKCEKSINPSNFKQSFFVQDLDDDADYVKFDIAVLPIDAAPNAGIKTYRNEFSVPIKGGIRVDVSSGVMFNMGLQDKNYHYVKDPQGNGYFIREKKHKFYESFQPTIAVLLHVYRRNAFASNRVAGSFGMGTSDAQRIKYYLGGSWIFGRGQRLVVTGGCVIGQVNVLHPDLQMGTAMPLSEAELIQPVAMAPQAPFRLGCFLGISFNLTGDNKAKAMKGSMVYNQ